MIKTHKPRGHFWTNASVFQQSKEIRNINYEDCTPPATSILSQDPEDDLRPSERAAKRRRIETLADNFLNGEPLKLSCCRPTPASLKAAVEGNERSRKGQKWTWPEYEFSEDENELWVDLDDSWPQIRQPKPKHSARGNSRPGIPKCKTAEPATRRSDMDTHSLMEVEEAQSTCKAVPRRTVPKLSTQPSSEALSIAAALRNRNIHRAASEIPPRLDSSSQGNTPEEIAVGSQSAPTPAARPRYFRTRKPAGTEWLLRRNTVLHEVSPDESVDELGRSTMGATPSRTQGEALVPGPGQEIEGLPELQQQVLQPVALGPGKSSADPLSLSFSQKMAAAAQEAGNRSPRSSHTAIGGTSKGSQLAYRHSQDDSETRMLNKYGLSGSSRTSWHAVNEGSSIPVANESSAAGVDEATPSPGTVRNDPEDLTEGDNGSKKGRRATSTRKSAGSSRRQSDRSRAPISEGTDEVRRLDPTTARHGYTESGSAQEGGTPFMFRKKRGSKSDPPMADPVSKGDKSAQTRKSMQSATSKGISGAVINHQEGDGEINFPGAPQYNLKLKPYDSPTKEPDLSLMEEHMNSKLPQDPGSTERSSGVKRALRKSMEEAGATFDHVAVSPASSRAKTSPVSGELEPGISALGTAARSSLARSEALEAQEDRDQHAWQDSGTSNNDTGRTSLRGTAENARRETLNGSQEPWLGTQNMLYQAQRDLFISPEKPTGTPSLNLDETFASTAPPAESTNRPPLRELSQENLPSTQAMMNAWSPWTAMKKPRAAQEPLPVAAGDSPLVPTPLSRPPNKSVSDLKQQNPTSGSAHGETGSKNRRSSLRFSSTNTVSPAQPSRLEFSITKSSSAEEGEEASRNQSSSASNGLSITSKPPPELRHSSQDRPMDLASTWDPSTLIPSQPSHVNNNHASGCETHHPLPRHAEAESQAITTDAFPSFGDVTGFDVATEEGDLRYEEDNREMGGSMSQGSLDRAVEGLARDVLVRSTEEMRGAWGS
ncbi:hypothetical protein KC343_g8029 [Hortaea werneckii]|uniref:Uncharacterized protein n=1 Tax=Hortaea werneckii TaxID=91943 RepID=A0A3M7FZ03_HORWE|nr:hypothetical protein KC323_g5379 [Hortaea werneckii]KAI7225141.1 hypothetical protein KC352_g15880 [Hortaea werneckii]KAI7562466.1 hypothetical protein KC317_g8385 [Hortaea werneckii]KAI7611791.1 hypothetical protein KC346_g8110 [Hortaea werneckii]KAI7621407.1 hypothetical protein KC343_g8029 [Hortaea werneckii]